MPTYWQEVQRLPPPSDTQISKFVDYVAGAHSWYKHLPLTPPGIPFHFFLDPYVGCDLAVQGARTLYRERTEPGFHYSDLPTAEYRQRFGYLQYSANAGTSILVPRAKGTLVVSSARGPISFTPTVCKWKRLLGWFRHSVPTDVVDVLGAPASSPTIYSAEQDRVSVPAEVLGAGSVELTGIIHPIASTLWIWRNRSRLIGGPQGRPIEWPAATGGPETLLRILRFLQDNADEKGTHYQLGDTFLLGFHPELHRLVDPERQRLKKLMEQAIRRMVTLIYDSPAV